MKCPHCGGEINPASVLGSAKSEKKKTAAQINGAKGGRPKKPKESIVKELEVKPCDE